MKPKKPAFGAVILIHEIYGINGHMLHYEKHFSEMGYQVFCPNLLTKERPFPYSDESEAYRHFSQHVGFKQAAKQVSELIEECAAMYESIFLVGFSAGATIAWLCSEKKELAGIVGYYGSRIRDYLDVMPACPALLFFAAHEKSFDANKMPDQVTRQNTEVVLFNGDHGFSDPFNASFNENLSTEAFGLAVSFLNKHSKNTSMET
ncbi:dienelactone hydrolase family protein [Planomicrobium sp. CPCC 101079]|uniref:dienelactone hydrolase family protein n=1 Tax=Planomicrobium sp. CPCC 101079 TaxID=2599618 RepID=UPI0011B4748C|nr:dienelactone hydrolase family protein [Planomicrobium sp. CPCC 101079]TWT13131.1 dienelactone hydrolase family protein [Planomicrobium sp. CPCC 101079]